MTEMPVIKPYVCATETAGITALIIVPSDNPNVDIRYRLTQRDVRRLIKELSEHLDVDPDPRGQQ